MTEFTRRKALYGVAAGGAAALAGCTDAGDPVSGGGGSDGGGNNADGDGGDGEVSTAVQQVGEPISGVAWDRRQRRGICVLITERYGDGTGILGEAPEPAHGFVSETDFAESVVCYVESVGPTTCHDEIAFDGVDVEDGTLVADATVRGADDDGVACGEAITHSSALLRVTGDPLPETARLSVTDGWGETGTVHSDDGVRDPAGLAGGIRPDGDPPNVPASFECDAEGFKRHPQAYDGEVNWGGGGGTGSDAGGDGPLALRVVTPGDDAGNADDLAVARGERFRIELTNVSGHTTYVGAQAKYNLEIRTESGWTELRGTDGDPIVAYNDLAISVPPDGTLNWEFEMTETGLVEDGPRADAFRVCPELVPGRYRFVFFGAADLAVAFDYRG